MMPDKGQDWPSILHQKVRGLSVLSSSTTAKKKHEVLTPMHRKTPGITDATERKTPSDIRIRAENKVQIRLMIISKGEIEIREK